MASRVQVLEDYDPALEVERARWPDVVVRGHRLSRLTARVDVRDEEPGVEEVRRRHEGALLPTTLEPSGPVVALDWPIHGPFVRSPRGVYLDTYLAVAMKLLDHHHPRFVATVEALQEADLLLRREIATDDYLTLTEPGAVKTLPDLAARWAEAAGARWPHPAGWRLFASSSGAESVEAALKLSYETAYKRFLARHGMETLRSVQAALGTQEVAWFRRDPALAGHPVFADYPFQVVACEGSFHGRTLGALALTRSKKAHQLAYPKPWNVHHVPFNALPGTLRELVDMRGIDEILAVPGELARVLREQRRIPRDLFAAFVAEPFQGEGGYVPGEARFFAEAREVCDATGALLVLDEVQTVARTGRLFMAEHLDVRPDVLCCAKSMVIGVTLARGDLARDLHVGWHSNTWGGGRVFDVNFAYATLDALLGHRDEAFGGLSYLENEEVKAGMLHEGLDRLAERHPGVMDGWRGVGLMNAILVRRREEVIRVGWRRGLKLLGCGLPGEVAGVRLLMLADTLGREVDELVRVLDEVLGEVGRG